MSDDAPDWRLEVLRTRPYLHGLEWVRRPYVGFSPDWDHDHCCACSVKLAETRLDADTQCEGYATTSKYEHGAGYEWLCVGCFERFEAEMEWVEELS